MPRHLGARLARRATLIATASALLILAATCAPAGAAVPVCPPAPASAGLSAPPPGEVLPVELTVVCAGALPITQATYAHWLTVAQRSQASAPVAPTAQQQAALRTEVLGFLITVDWIKEEASALKIVISPAQVRRRFDRIRAQEFPKPHQFERFLRKSGQSVADLLLRVEQSLLSARLTRRALAGRRTKAAQEHALAGFVKAFKARWQPQTYCVTEYTDPDCGHVQAVL